MKQSDLEIEDLWTALPPRKEKGPSDFMTTTCTPKIPLVDLAANLTRIRPAIDLAIKSVVDSCYFVGAPIVKTFEQEFADHPYPSRKTEILSYLLFVCYVCLIGYSINIEGGINIEGAQRVRG